MRGKLKILFELGYFSYGRHFDPVIEALESRGHDVVRSASCKSVPGLVATPVADLDHRSLLMKSAMLRDDALGVEAYMDRCALDCLMYRNPELAGVTLTRERIFNHLRHGVQGADRAQSAALADRIPLLDDAEADRLAAELRAREEERPHCEPITEWMASIDPDVFVITPLVITQYGQADMVKSARELGIPVVFAANSWDNLTTKGAIHCWPDSSVVWNEIQRIEAHRIHGLSPETVAATGAPRFDAFFARKPEVERDEFCREAGFDPGAPIILYLCSSNLISGNEFVFVEQWLARLRTAGGSLADAGVLIRPHPKFRDGWEERFGGQERVSVQSSPVLNDDATLYHALHHCRAVVGANTSAELEAAILHKPVFTVHHKHLSTGQTGTVHFTYLLRENGGIVTPANSLEEHLSQLKAELAQPEIPNRNKEFLASFLRPGGLEVPAAAVTARAIEEMVR